MRHCLLSMPGVRYPISQAPIGSFTHPELAASVANARCVGMLALSWTPPEEIYETINDTRGRTDGAFEVNLVLEWDQTDRLEAALDAGCRLRTCYASSH